jgi:hypothetical protein
VKPVMGREAVIGRWHAVLADVDKLAKPGKPEAVYPKNNEFWREVGEVAIHVAASDEVPSKWDLAISTVKESVLHLPETLSHAATNLVSGAGHAVGTTAGAVGVGVMTALKSPLLIGAGLLGLYLVTRKRSPAKEA